MTEAAKGSPRVLFLTSSFPQRDGDTSGTFVFRLAKQLVSEGGSVQVVTPGGPALQETETLEGVEISRFHYMWPRNAEVLAYGHGIPHNLRSHPIYVLLVLPLLVAWFIRGLRIAKNADVIHAHWITTGIVAVPIARLRRKPLVITMWGSDMRILPHSVSRWILSRADRVIGFGPEAQEFASSLGISARNLPAPVDTDLFNPTTSAKPILDELEIKAERHVVSSIGRLAPEKDPLTFIRACRLISQERKDVEFIVCGDGPLHRELETELALSTDELRVHVLGARSDIPQILAATTLFVSTSPLENVWSATIAEASFIGVPCILTDVGTTSQVFTHGHHAWLIPPNDPIELARAVSHLLDNQDIRQALTRQSRDLHVAHGFEPKTAAQGHLQVYRELIQSNKS